MKCTKKCRFLFALAAVALVLAILFPLWSYYIVMPLYPEGLILNIYSYKLEGNLNSINTLNHYTGLPPLDPSTFPELKIIPIVLIILSISAIAVSILGNALLARLYFLSFVILGIVGLADFYFWLYRYGHSVDPNAPLAIEPQTLVMLGVKKILTIEIYAYPNLGTLFLVLAGILTFFGLFGVPKGVLKLSVLLLISCSAKPQDIKIGKDACDYCKMIISDSRFSSEIVLKTGKVYKFDDVGCMINFFWEKGYSEKDIALFLVSDYKSGKLIDATRAFYILNDNLRSPMSYNVAAFENADDAENFYNKNGGRILNWAELNEYVRKHSLR